MLNNAYGKSGDNEMFLFDESNNSLLSATSDSTPTRKEKYFG